MAQKIVLFILTTDEAIRKRAEGRIGVRAIVDAKALCSYNAVSETSGRCGGMADAADLKSSVRKGMPVRVRPSVVSLFFFLFPFELIF